MTQVSVEKAASLAAGTLSRYERGEKEPRLDTLRRVLDVFDADLFDLGLEARRASGRAVPAEARNGGSDFTPDQLKRLDEEAHLTAYSLTVRHLRTLRGQIEPDPEDLES